MLPGPVQAGLDGSILRPVPRLAEGWLGAKQPLLSERVPLCDLAVSCRPAFYGGPIPPTPASTLPKAGSSTVRLYQTQEFLFNEARLLPPVNGVGFRRDDLSERCREKNRSGDGAPSYRRFL